ncbi:MAG: sensor histidine kinase [Alphaproteobacteria bacterium]
MSDHFERAPIPRAGYFRLTLNFALGAATVLIVAALVVIMSNDAGRRAQMAAIAAESNADFVHSFANTFWPRYREFVSTAHQQGADTLRGLPEATALASDLANHARGVPVLDVKIYDTRGITAFSSDSSQTGIDRGRDPRFLDVLAGNDTAELQFHKTIDTFEGPATNRWVLSNLVPIRAQGRNGAVQGVAEVSRDVTSLVAGVEALRQRDLIVIAVAFVLTFLTLVFFVWTFNKIMHGEHDANLRLTARIWRLKSANDAKNEFLAHMGHELRTPLNSIIGFAQLIRDEIRGPIDNPHYKSYIVDIYNSGQNLLLMIEDVLDLVKAENRKMDVAPRTLDVAEAARRAIRTLPAPLKQGGHAIEVTTSDTPRKIETDPDILRRIMVNLLSNAIKFSPPGSRIDIAIDQQPEKDTRIRIIDRGIGMSEGEILIACTPFGQVEHNQGGAQQGKGLGLPLCQKLTEVLGGSLKIESRPGDGTVVTLTLPDSAPVAGIVAPTEPADEFVPTTPRLGMTG